MGRLHTFVVTLRRDSREVNWGLRLVGGSDLATPLIVTRVTPGTPAGKELVRGDIIAKIDDYDARDLRHEDAQNLFRNAPKQIKLVVQRGGASAHLYSLPRSPGSFVGRVPTPTFYHEFAEDVDRDGPRSTTPMAPRSPIPMAAAAPYRTPSPQPGWRGPESLPRTPVPPHGPAGPAGLPHYSYPLQLEGEYRTLMLSPSSTRTDDTLDESIQSQPYRTTPLVLPGAKVRREPGPTESYLRHHPNPAMRAPPSHDYRDTLMRQKVAESVLQRVVGEEGNKVVHKQFNSPINLYSEQNIANSIRQQTSPLPHKPTVQYDPARSETFRALQEDGITGDLHEVPTPVTPKVFTAPANKKPVPRPIKPEEKPKGKQTTFVNSLHEEHIQQSNSFKRLMYNVLGDTEF
ncbi:PDZ and LIM domain protein 7 isoform X3 [Spodoptera frugiperda]|uniref:PDZ and LIM domain protein 7 isoform X3 n=1 Tax=Spodoptera frugiperda TaxID=7108 RepID=A0A9R0ET53_SPOFR|nr:PDZ and LIM domain protein 7 isoform X3 [Spodoptera frugiperda]